MSDFNVRHSGDQIEFVLSVSQKDFNEDYIARAAKWLRAELLARKSHLSEAAAIELADDARQEWWKRRGEKTLKELGL